MKPYVHKQKCGPYRYIAAFITHFILHIYVCTYILKFANKVSCILHSQNQYNSLDIVPQETKSIFSMYLNIRNIHHRCNLLAEVS